MQKPMTIGKISLAIFTFSSGLYFYPQLPEKYASHWNIAGEVDGYFTKFWGVFLLAILMAFGVTLLSTIPRFEPFPENVRSFRN